VTSLPPSSDVKLGLVIDLDICVGCHACVVNCKEWNTAGYGAPLADSDPYGKNPSGAWLNRIHTFEAGKGADARVVNFTKYSIHFE
jgi:Fe-S-cluster-containing dehydrogenase component